MKVFEKACVLSPFSSFYFFHFKLHIFQMYFLFENVIHTYNIFWVNPHFTPHFLLLPNPNSAIFIPNTSFSFIYITPSLCSHQLLIAPQWTMNSPVSTLEREMSWSCTGCHNSYESIVATSLSCSENTICTTLSYPLTLTNSSYHLPRDLQEGI